jgi:hypothetical protein
MRTEEEIKIELLRLSSLKESPPSPINDVNYGNSYLEALTALNRVEKGARISILQWVLGAERS